MDMIFGCLYLLFFITTSKPLKIQSCCHLKSIDISWNPSNQGRFYFELTVDNDPSTLQTSNSFDPPNGASNSNIDQTFCWVYDSSNITITTFKPDSALNIQIRMKNSTQALNILTVFKHPQIITNSEPSFENKTINSINFNLYHKINMTNTLLKISNRNFIIKRNCFQLYSICFYEVDTFFPNCLNTMNSLATKPAGAISTVFKNLSTTTNWSPSPIIDTGDTCYEPYQQYVLFDISGIAFTSIGLGVLQTIENDTIGTNTTAPRYWSFAFGDKTIISTGYDRDMLYDQYWVVDLFDSNVFINENTINQPFFNINPLYFMLDTAPSRNRIRMDEIYFGRPEQYLVNTSLFRFGNDPAKNSNERKMFTTWTWIGSNDDAIWDDGTPEQDKLDNQTFKIGQYAQIACKNAINYDINNTPIDTYYLSSIKPTSINDRCYGMGPASSTVDICVYENKIFYPPMAFRVDQNNGNGVPLLIKAYCQADITAVNHFAQCTKTNQCDGPDRDGGPFVQCDYSVTGAASAVPYWWECVLENVTQINTAFPTRTPTQTPTSTPIVTLTPTKTPTLVPSYNPTGTPSSAPYTPGTPSASPDTNSPTSNPSITPTQITNNPSIAPSIYLATTTMSPTIITTSNPTISAADDDPDDPDDGDDTIINIYNINLGWIELIIAAVILCICCCLVLLLLLLRSKKKNSKEESELVYQASQRSFQDGTYHQSTRQSFNVTVANKDQIEMESQYTDTGTRTATGTGTGTGTKTKTKVTGYSKEFDYTNKDGTTTAYGVDKALDIIAGNEQTAQKYSM